MNNTLDNNLITLILGNELEPLDGLHLSAGKDQGCYTHIDSLNRILKSLKMKNLSLDYINMRNIHDSAFDLMNHGHALFLNVKTERINLGYLFIPDLITDKQLETLTQFENELNSFKLQLVTISKDNPEFFDEKEYENNFSVELLKQTKRK